MIHIHELTKSFGPKTATTRVLDNVSLDVPDGMITVLLGRSGSGKSVLLKHIVGLLEPDTGYVEVDGRRVDRGDPEGLRQVRREIGYVFQFAALFDSLTVEGNLRLGLERQGLAESEIESRVSRSLAVVGLPDVRDQQPGDLSGGMRKRIGIARAVALQPRYILWDEPTSGLDPVTSATIDRLMRRITDEFGTTGVVVTHDMRSAFTIGDRIAMLHNGQIRAVGSSAEIKATTDPVVRGFIEGHPE